MMACSMLPRKNVVGLSAESYKRLVGRPRRRDGHFRVSLVIFGYKIGRILQVFLSIPLVLIAVSFSFDEIRCYVAAALSTRASV
jgi:hypothetical protein